MAAAYGLALTAHSGDDLQGAAAELRSTRPTAVNLAWALDRVLALSPAGVTPTKFVTVCRGGQRDPATKTSRAISASARRRRATAGRCRVLTHCNAGALATGGYGTALGVVRAAVESGKRVRVIADETRPLLQGARLTAWELARDGIDCTVIVDSAAGSLMRRKAIDAVIVGADRIAANGDVANKIGTYSLAVLGARTRHPLLRRSADEHDRPLDCIR